MRMYTEMNIISILIVGLLLITVSRDAVSQFRMGNMEVSTSDIENKLVDDAINRRVRATSEHVIVTKAARAATVELSNPTKDTLVVDFYLSDTVVDASRFVTVDTPMKKSPAKAEEKRLIKDDPSDSITSIYRPMSHWIKDVPKSISIAPGEKTSIAISVDMPENVRSGEYAVWLVAEVRPYKNIPDVKKAVYTITKVKITSKHE